jgi:hypothetical protein
MRNRYTVSVQLGSESTTTVAKTYQQIADQVNAIVGYDVVSKNIIVNWLSRGRKSKKYSFITIT